MLKDMRVGITWHHPVLQGRRVTVNDYQAAESAAPRQERLLDPSPVISAENVPRHIQGCLRINRRIDATMHENDITEPHMGFQLVQLSHCRVPDGSSNQALSQYRI